jgi:hypothetical protein
MIAQVMLGVEQALQDRKLFQKDLISRYYSTL